MTNQFLQRLKGRVKHGLLTQEILDRAGRLGLLLMPYTIVDESPGLSLNVGTGSPSYTVRPLTADDMPLLANLPGRERDVEKILARLNDAECLGIFVDDALAGYSWSRFDQILHARQIQLHTLGPDEAYLFDLYIVKAYRGLGIAHVLRQQLYRHLAAKGIKRFYSISLYFNRSTRKFKARLGASEMELRVLLKLRSIVSMDFRLKRYTGNSGLFTKRVYFVRS